NHQIDMSRLSQQTLALLLRDAASDDERAIRLRFLKGAKLPKKAHQFMLGLLAHAAGVDDDQIGLFAIVGRPITRALEHLLDPPRVVDVHLATKSLYVI